MQDDSCDACGSYDTTALLGRTGDEIHLSGLHIKPAPFYYEPEDTEDGFYEGDFDDDL